LLGSFIDSVVAALSGSSEPIANTPVNRTPSRVLLHCLLLLSFDGLLQLTRIRRHQLEVMILSLSEVFNSSVYALNGTTGAVLWIYLTGDSVYSSQQLELMGRSSNVYTLNGFTGAVKWSYLTGGIVSSSPAIASDGTVGSNDFNAYALDGYSTGNIIRDSPAIGRDGTVFFGSYDRYMYALNSSTGALKWNFTTGGFFSSGPRNAEQPVG